MVNRGGSQCDLDGVEMIKSRFRSQSQSRECEPTVLEIRRFEVESECLRLVQKVRKVVRGVQSEAVQQESGGGEAQPQIDTG